LDQGLVSIIINIVSVAGALIAVWIGSRLGRSNDKRKRVRESLEEIYKLSNQVNIWIQVNLRYFYKEIAKGDYHRPSMPPEYVVEYTKVPECPIDQLVMLISFDAPSLAKHLPEYSFIVSEMREVRYIYDTHRSIDILDYYFGGITFDEYKKMSGKQVNSMDEFLHYVEGKFPQLQDDLGTALNGLARKN
jgi:hypothetical protein